MSYFYYQHAAAIAPQGYFYSGLTPTNAKKVTRIDFSSSTGHMRHEIRYGKINEQVLIAVLYTTAQNPNASYEFPSDTLLDSTQVLQVTMVNLDSAAQDGHYTIQYS